MLQSLFNKVAGLQACNFIKKTLTQVLSFEYCEMFNKKNICKRLLLEGIIKSFEKTQNKKENGRRNIDQPKRVKLKTRG